MYVMFVLTDLGPISYLCNYSWVVGGGKSLKFEVLTMNDESLDTAAEYSCICKIIHINLLVL